MIKHLYQAFKNLDWFERSKEKGEDYREIFALLNDNKKVIEFANFYDSCGNELQIVIAYLLNKRAMNKSKPFDDKSFDEYRTALGDMANIWVKAAKEASIKKRLDHKREK